MIGDGFSSPKLALEKSSAQRTTMVVEQGFIPMWKCHYDKGGQRSNANQSE